MFFCFVLFLEGTTWAAHGAVEIETMFIQIIEKEPSKGATQTLRGLQSPTSGKKGVVEVLSGAEARTAIKALQKLKSTDVLATPFVTSSGKRASI